MKIFTGYVSFIALWPALASSNTAFERAMNPTGRRLARASSKLESTVMSIKMEAHQRGKALGSKRITGDEIKNLTQGLVATCDEDTGLAVGKFPCKNMDMVYFLDGMELGSPYASNPDPVSYATYVSDIWGWTDPETGHEYALVGMWDGTSIVDITNPYGPQVICFVETTGGVVDGLEDFYNSWRDIKVMGNVMYIGSEVSFHGLATFDLTKLKDMPPSEEVPIVSPDYVAPELGSSHNIVVAPGAGKVIAVGMWVGDPACPVDFDLYQFATLSIFDVTDNPVEPTFETCVYLDIGGRNFNENWPTGYVHDAHCIVYDGPDAAYKGMNICALFMESVVTIYSLDTMEVINVFSYEGASYTHQGWFSEDHTTIYVDDELDELFETSTTDFSTCYIFDVSDLDGEIMPAKTFITPSAHPSIDHNLYVKGDYVYQAAYTSGARVRKIMEDDTLEEVAYFDGEDTCECVVASVCDCDPFAGTWTFYPYFESGFAIAGGIAEGLFIVMPKIDCDVTLQLWDATNDYPIGPFPDTIDTSMYSVGLNVEAVARCADKVSFTLKDSYGNKIMKNVEGNQPYTLGDDLDVTADILPVPKLMEPGSYILKVNPMPGKAFEVSFTVV